MDQKGSKNTLSVKIDRSAKNPITRRYSLKGTRHLLISKPHSKDFRSIINGCLYFKPIT